MAKQNFRNLVAIAHTLSESDPILGNRLEHLVNSIYKISVVNPGIQTFEEQVQQAIDELDQIQAELKSVKEADDITKAFKDMFEAQKADLDQLSEGAEALAKVSSRVAGLGDWLKTLFKGKDKGESADYSISEDQMESFVEGSQEWKDAAEYISAEYDDNKDFFDGLKKIKEEMAKIKNKADAEAVGALLETVESLLKKGNNILNGVRSYQQKVTLEGDEDLRMPENVKGIELEDSIFEALPNTEIQLEGGKYGLQDIVKSYVDKIKDAGDDDNAIAQLIVNLVKDAQGALKASPLAASDKSVAKTMLPIMVRMAYSLPNARPTLLRTVRKFQKFVK